LVATQTRPFLFADIEGSAQMAQVGHVYAGVAADNHLLIRAGVAADGG
jgi:hypothetical protein